MCEGISNMISAIFLKDNMNMSAEEIGHIHRSFTVQYPRWHVVQYKEEFRIDFWHPVMYSNSYVCHKDLRHITE